MEFQMQVGSLTASRIPTNGDQLSFRHRVFRRRKDDICWWRRFLVFVDDVRLSVCFAMTTHCCPQYRNKVLEMTIHAGVAIRVLDIDGISEAGDTNGDSAHITFTNRKDRFPHGLLRLHVDATVEMVRSGLTKVSRQRYRIVDGR